MRSHGVIEAIDVSASRGPCLWNADVGSQGYLLVFDCPPQALDKDIVPLGAFPNHADPDLVLHQKTGEGAEGELGGFNQSSQHFDNGGCGEANGARCQTRCPSQSSMSRAAYGGGAGELPTVLGGEPWAVKRGGCYRISAQ